MTQDEYDQILRLACKDVVTKLRKKLANKIAEALHLRCEAIMLGALRGDGNAVTTATERGIEPVQPRDLWVDPLRPTPMDDQEFRRVCAEDARRRAISWCGAMAFNSVVAVPERCVFVDVDDELHHYQEQAENGALSWKFTVKPSRELRYLQLRGNEQQPLRKLGEINAILEAEGYLEVSGEGVMPCPTKSHEIVRENKGAKQLIKEMA